MKRRGFLGACTIPLLSVVLDGANAAVVEKAAKQETRLRAGAFGQRFPAMDGATTLWGFNGSSPGPLLRFRKGERVSILVDNALPEMTTVHWHGVRVPFAMDGVPHLTQPPIKPGERFHYEFDLRDSGTFWYHPHQKSFEQVGRGLFGAFIVEEEAPIEVDRDLVWVLADLLLDPASGDHAPFGQFVDHAGDGRLGNVITINGQATDPALALDVRSGERLRLRLINSATARVFRLHFDQHQPFVIAYDGQAVTPHKLPEGTILLGPGMRVDLVLDCPAAPATSFTISDSVSKRELATLRYAEQARLAKTLWSAPLQLKPNELPVPNMKKPMTHTIDFRGGSSGPPVIGVVDGKEISYQDMHRKYGLAWTVNSHAVHEESHEHIPLLTLKQGTTHVITMTNGTGFVHPMHLHGHFFRVLDYNGVKPKYEEWRDTVFMYPWDEVTIALVAEERGDWMFHCHILEHAAAGMMGVIRIE